LRISTSYIIYPSPRGFVIERIHLRYSGYVVNFYKFLNFKIIYDLSKRRVLATNGIAAVAGSNQSTRSIFIHEGTMALS
jgi:hypothetical protein